MSSTKVHWKTTTIFLSCILSISVSLVSFYVDTSYSPPRGESS